MEHLTSVIRWFWLGSPSAAQRTSGYIRNFDPKIFKLWPYKTVSINYIMKLGVSWSGTPFHWSKGIFFGRAEEEICESKLSKPSQVDVFRFRPSAEKALVFKNTHLKNWIFWNPFFTRIAICDNLYSIWHYKISYFRLSIIMYLYVSL